MVERGKRAGGPVTYQDIVDLPEHKVGEIVSGDLYASPRPAGTHGVAATVLATLLVPPFQFGRGGPSGWWILMEPELHLGEDVLVPDLAGWRRERLPDVGAAHFETPPDWICEVLSPSTAKLDRIRKMPLYAAAGVPHAWLVDPLSRTLETFENDGGLWRVTSGYAEAEEVRAAPFEELELELSLLWVPEPQSSKSS